MGTRRDLIRVLSGLPLAAMRADPRLAAVAAGALALIPGSPEARPGYGIKGQTAPEFEVDWWIDENGRPGAFSMNEARGKWVYLKCFQSWCPGCHKYGFPALKQVADAFAGSDRVVAVAVQTVFEGFGVNTRAKVREIQLQYRLPITMGHDPGSHDAHPSTMRLYRTGGTPWVVIVSPEGQVVFNDFHADPDKVIAFLGDQVA